MIENTPTPSEVRKRWLLGTQCTAHDAGAERVAIALASRGSGHLDVVVPLTTNAEYEAVAPELAARAEKRTAAGIQALRSAADLQGVRLDLEVRRGPEPEVDVVDEARRRRSDVIVVRRRGERGFFARRLVGEMVLRVVAHAPCDVLLVPDTSALWSQGVLLVVDPGASTEQRMAGVEAAVAMAAMLDLPVHLACLSGPENPIAQVAIHAAQSELHARHRGGQIRFMAGDVETGLGTVAAELPADLLVVGRDAFGSGSDALSATLVKIIGLARGPVLVVQRKGA